jgi:short-subunit dehydrogenase
MTWIVTGASRGLGRHLVQQLAQRGHEVLAIARDAARLQALADQCGGKVHALPLDLGDAAAIGPAMAAALERVPTLSGLVHNAGIGAYKPFIDTQPADSLQTMQVNVNAAIQLCHALVPRLVAQKRGHVVFIGSDLGRRPLANMAVYVASKHALTGFAHSLLRELKPHQVKVSLINPGIIDTDFGAAEGQTLEGTRDESWSLRPAHLAALILEVLAQPGSMVVDELTVHPLGQGDF